MKGQNYADLIRRLARGGRVEATPSPPADKARLVSAVEQALRARARRRVLRRRGAVGATFAVAAALALVVAGRPWRAAAPELAATPPTHPPRALTVLATSDAMVGAAVTGTSPPVALTSGMAIGAGLTLRAPATGEVRVGTADGTSLALEAGGELTVTETGATQRFALRSGAVSARVSRLFAGERFVIDTRDAEVEVHGTAFRVATVPAVATCGDGTTTRVSVTEGVVRVRAAGREVDVPPGAAWPAGCGARASRDGVRASSLEASSDHLRGHLARARAVESAEAPTERPAAAVAASAALPLATPTTPTSSLAAENDLFEAAVRAKKQGRLDEAARLFEQLVTGHPSSPLVESALVQRMKLLAIVDPAGARRAAAAYLDRFPGGFARPEAQALVDRAAP